MPNSLPPRPLGFTLLALFGGVLILQLLLALGVPLTGAAWGTQLDAQPGALQVASAVAALVVVFAMLVIAEKIGLLALFKRPRFINGVLWFFAAYLLLNAIGNALSPGGIEKWVMTPLALVAALLCGLLARAPFPNRA
jgi:hypothetical protein